MEVDPFFPVAEAGASGVDDAIGTAAGARPGISRYSPATGLPGGA
jgi:hypothetical protein